MLKKHKRISFLVLCCVHLKGITYIRQWTILIRRIDSIFTNAMNFLHLSFAIIIDIVFLFFEKVSQSIRNKMFNDVMFDVLNLIFHYYEIWSVFYRVCTHTYKYFSWINAGEYFPPLKIIYQNFNRFQPIIELYMWAWKCWHCCRGGTDVIILKVTLTYNQISIILMINMTTSVRGGSAVSSIYRIATQIFMYSPK